MPRRRRDHEPDKRPDWRNADMPVLREMDFNGVSRLTEVPPEEEQEWCADVLDKKLTPKWRADDTYNLGEPGIATKRARRGERRRRR